MVDDIDPTTVAHLLSTLIEETRLMRVELQQANAHSAEMVRLMTARPLMQIDPIERAIELLNEQREAGTLNLSQIAQAVGMTRQGLRKNERFGKLWIATKALMEREKAIRASEGFTDIVRDILE